MTMQSWNQVATGSRYFLNIGKFGTAATPIAEAAKPEEVSLNKGSQPIPAGPAPATG
jgi:hypothetical protein